MKAPYERRPARNWSRACGPESAGGSVSTTAAGATASPPGRSSRHFADDDNDGSATGADSGGAAGSPLEARCFCMNLRPRMRDEMTGAAGADVEGFSGMLLRVATEPIYLRAAFYRQQNVNEK